MRKWFLLITLLSGCAAPTHWAKQGASQQDYQTDSYNCEKDVRQSGHFGNDDLVASINMEGFFDRCMVAHGYHQEQVSAAAPVVSGSPYGPVSLADAKRSCDYIFHDAHDPDKIASYYGDINVCIARWQK